MPLDPPSTLPVLNNRRTVLNTKEWDYRHAKEDRTKQLILDLGPYAPSLVPDYDAIIADMFSTKSGAQFDNADPTTMRNTRTGSGTVTSGTAVGWQADLSQLGGMSLNAFIAAQSNLVPNGTFDTDTLWTKGAGWSIGSGVATHTPGSNSYISQAGIFTIGEFYEITITATVNAGLCGFVTAYWFPDVSITVSGTYTFILKKINSTGLDIYGTSAFDGSIDNVVIKHIPGNHRVALTDAARPVWTDSTLKWLDHDGVDDYLPFRCPTRGALCYIATAANTADSVGTLFGTTSTSNYVYIWSGGSTNTGIYTVSGTPVLATDGVTQSPTNRGDVEALITNGTQVIEALSLDLTPVEWATAGFWQVSGGTLADVNEFGAFFLDSAPSTEQRAAIQNWLATRSGATLA